MTSLAALAALEESGRLRRGDAAMVAGLSLGEYTALCAAGSLAFEDGLRLVRIRGQAMQAASLAKPSSMSAVLGLDEKGIADACREASSVGIVAIANKNAPGQIVISGELEALAAAEKGCQKRGAETLHSPHSRRRFPQRGDAPRGRYAGRRARRTPRFFRRACRSIRT